MDFWAALGGVSAGFDSLRGAAEGLRAGDGAGSWSSVLFGGSLGGFGFWAVSVGLVAVVDSLRGAAEGLCTGEGALDSSVC